MPDLPTSTEKGGPKVSGVELMPLSDWLEGYFAVPEERRPRLDENGVLKRVKELENDVRRSYDRGWCAGLTELWNGIEGGRREKVRRA